MSTKGFEDHLARVIGFGGFFTTIFVAAWWTTEPVNAPKMLSLTIVASICVVLMVLRRRFVISVAGKTAIFGLIFVLLSSFTLFTSADPVELNLYGVSGRNTGFLTYFSLVVVFISSSLLRTYKSFQTILKGFAAAGLVNVVYCLFSIAGIELLPWNNIYNTILGTFGNPNFIGAFLGIFSIVTLAYLLSPGLSIALRIFLIILMGITFIEILASNAIQGLFVLGFGSVIVFWIKLRNLSSSRIIESLYLIVVSTSGLLATLGALQIGPLTKYIYKTSVSLRGEYWQAAWNMGMQHPLTGVGMDSYGSWYRRARGIEALIRPGVNTTTNAAHNVFLDIFAYGGFPLFLSYIAINLLVLLAALKLLFKSREYDFMSVALVSGWVCYQAQSAISINQIGIAIWGWIFGGLILAYGRFKTKLASTESTNIQKAIGKPKKISNNSDAGLVIATFLGFVVGIVLSVRPVLADAGWKTALASGNGNLLAASAESWPLDQQRLTQAVNIFIENNWPKAARSLAEKNISTFSDSYMAWFAYLQLRDITESEKVKAKSELHRLDPNNPEFK